MTPSIFLRVAIDPALTLLPPEVTSPAARAMMLAIALQESKLRWRRQLEAAVPAMSFYQFEHGNLSALAGVLRQPKTIEHAQGVLRTLGYNPTAKVEKVRLRTRDNDVLASAMARLLLWTLPMPLPVRRRAAEAWDQYLESWRPGRPRIETWEENWMTAWEAVVG